MTGTRHIIFRFLQDKVKSAVLAILRKRKQVMWRNNRIYFLQKHKIEYALLYPAIMTFKLNKWPYEFSSPGEVTNLLVAELRGMPADRED